MLKSMTKSLPKNPGVYIFKDKLENIIYIGKAKNLKNRVSSYFFSNHDKSPKTQFLVKNIFDLDYIIVDNEVEALILENKLIKKHKPKYNINLKDKKTYPYIKITNEKIPKIIYTRKLDDKGVFFGPYTESKSARELIRLASSLFNIVTTKTYSSKSNLNYEIGIAPAKNISEIDEVKYMKNVEKMIIFLKGKTKPILKKLKDDMKIYSEKQEFEKALIIKKNISAIEHIMNEQKVDLMKRFDQDVVVSIFNEKINKSYISVINIFRGVISSKKDFIFEGKDEKLIEDFIKMFYSKETIPKEIIVAKKFWKDEDGKKLIEDYLSKFSKLKVKLIFAQRGDRKALVDMAMKNIIIKFNEMNVLVEMKNKLKLKKIPNIIECFDMSNLGGDYLVGGMTRFVNMKEDKENYRKYEIKSFKGKNDDFTAMYEVLTRRYKKLKDEGLEMPDLILIDGGKGHLNIAKKVLDELGLNIDLISVAKGSKRDKNEIYLVDCHDYLIFDNNSNMMLFIRRIRDSVHNFVISYNRKKRDMRLKEEFKDK